MSIVTDLQTLITNANATLDDLNGLIDQLEEQYPPTWCYEFDFTDSDGSWTAAVGHYSPTVGFVADYSQTSNGYKVVTITRNFAASVVTRIEMEFAYSPGTQDSTGDVNTLRGRSGSTNLLIVNYPVTSSPSSPMTVDGEATIDNIFAQVMPGAVIG